jgi:hypothetical protein
MWKRIKLTVHVCRYMYWIRNADNCFTFLGRHYSVIFRVIVQLIYGCEIEEEVL